MQDHPFRFRTSDFVSRLGVPEMAPLTSPFDPGYDLNTLQGHLEQSAHLMSSLKISMACWLIAEESVTRAKIAAAQSHGVAVVTGGGPFEIAVAHNELDAYLDLCADLGVSRIECGEGFTDLPYSPAQLMSMASLRGLEVQFELGKKHGGAFTEAVVSDLIDDGRRWLDAGATCLVIEARESAFDVGLFDWNGTLLPDLADRFVDAFGHGRVVFEAPDKRSQFALLSHFGPRVHVSNVRLEEVLRVEIYRRGLHADAFGNARLRPPLRGLAGV